MTHKRHSNADQPGRSRAGGPPEDQEDAPPFDFAPSGALDDDPTLAASPLDAAEERVRAAEDRHLRLLAEFDNFRRRTQREREQAFLSGKEDAVRPFLDVLDNLERAVTHGAETPGPWLDGVELTLRQFHEALKAAGVVAVDPLGEPFDPAIHEALTTQASGSVPEGHVAQVVSRGYRLGDRVLRPARVVVSSGGGA